jgi:hypothetical protein
MNSFALGITLGFLLGLLSIACMKVMGGESNFRTGIIVGINLKAFIGTIAALSG